MPPCDLCSRVAQEQPRSPNIIYFLPMPPYDLCNRVAQEKPRNPNIMYFLLCHSAISAAASLRSNECPPTCCVSFIRHHAISAGQSHRSNKRSRTLGVSLPWLAISTAEPLRSHESSPYVLLCFCSLLFVLLRRHMISATESLGSNEGPSYL